MPCYGMPPMLVADAIAGCLQRQGVEQVVGFPENRLLNSAAVLGMRPVITRTERVAVNVADGFARASDVDECLARLLAARRPVILAGQGVLYARATAELVDLAERTGIPVATTLNGKSAFPEDHPLALGTAARTRPEAVGRWFAGS